MFSDQILHKLQKKESKPWIFSDTGTKTRANVLEDMESLKTKLLASGLPTLRHLIVGIAMKTSYEFVVADLMCLANQSVSLPVPLEFDNDQIHSLLKNVDIVLTRSNKDSERLQKILPQKPVININQKEAFDLTTINPSQHHCIPDDIVKIIHTSGTTSEPKGVLIQESALSTLIDSLIEVFPKRNLQYLSICPMSLLVEQVFAIYLTLFTEGSLTILPESVKEFGSFEENNHVYLDLMIKAQPNFMYLAPNILETLNQLPSLEGIPKQAYFITGGAKVNHDTLGDLHDKGILVYEGYGLSETTSVVSINTPQNYKIGSAGKILPHLSYKIVKGELLLKGKSLCAGYFKTDDSSCEIDSQGYLHTGDLVDVDKDQHLIIKGRRKNLITLSNARNISPEWVESKLKKYSEIKDSIILGEGQDFITAIILSKGKNIEKIIDNVNQELPGFAKIRDLLCINNSDHFYKKYFTVTGRPKRTLLHKEYIKNA